MFLTVFFIGGCSLTRKFGNEAEAKQYVAEELEEKYGEEFAYNLELDKFSYDEYPSQPLEVKKDNTSQG